VIGDGVTFTSTTYIYPFTASEWVERSATRGRNTGNNGMISFEVDDTLPQQWTDLFPLTKRLGITVGAAWITGNAAAWLPEAYRHGWEIISHTVDHGNVTVLTEAQIQAMAESTLASIEAITGTRENVGFVYPAHVRTADTDRILSKFFTRGRGVADDRLYPASGVRDWLVATHLLDNDFAGGTMPENVKDLLRAVASTNGRMAFYFHFDAPKKITHPPALTQMIAFARSLGIQVVNPSEMWGPRNITRDPYDELGTKWTLGANFTRSTDYTYKGANSLKFTPGGGFTSGSVTSQLIPIAPQPGMFSVYRASFRRKNTVAVSISAGYGIALVTAQTLRNLDGTKTTLATTYASVMHPTSGTTIPIADWERTSWPLYVAPCVDSMNIVVSPTNIAGGAAPIYFDEIKMELVDYTPSVTYQGTLNGTTTVRVATGVPNLSRHAITLQARAPIAGRLSYTVSGVSVVIVSTDAADTAVVDIVIHAGPSYNTMAFPTTGA
jgi:peptidoglycan/xylan/chitin deacetylase (PgdA/CDA1 family)